ncbi:hypothetical protein BDN70DRAFT_878385 [Pholiota conissans]|uniref:Aminoglycoside phosphotransferase domain-containing protein n=1 Tax=Pholiota conissans TaxID=109636 RepID=A0A9P5Z249_9AGAR|nr:hypothetical protein BDN70DRAFT_878385 [Pholiota conissans]
MSMRRSCYNLHDGRIVKITEAANGAGRKEALVMDYIRLHTTVPVPRVLMIFQRRGWTYIVMEYVPGESLALYHEHPSSMKIRNIILQLEDIIRQIAAVAVPPQAILKSWDESPVKEMALIGTSVPSEFFVDVDEFNMFWLSRITKTTALFSNSPDDSLVEAAHGNLTDRNIIIENDKIVAILNWDAFGWYPSSAQYIPLRSHWEFLLLDTFCFPNTMDSERLGKIFNEGVVHPSNGGYESLPFHGNDRLEMTIKL